MKHISVFHKLIILLSTGLLCGPVLLFAQTETEAADSEDSGVTIVGKADASSVENQSQDKIVITSEQIEALHAATVMEVLQKNGCSIKSYGAYGSTSSVYIRGFSGSCVAILVDGVQVNSVQSGTFDLTRINVNDIERIEIIRGGSDSKYNVSGAVGGIVNIITKKGTEKKPSFYASIDNTSYSGQYLRSIFDTQQVTLGTAFKTQKSQWNISGAYTGAQNYFPYDYYYTNAVRMRENDEAYTGSAAIRGKFDLSDGMTLSFLNDGYYGNVYCPGTMTSVTVGDQKDTFLSSSVLLDVPFAGSDKLETQAQVSYKYDQIDYTEDINSSSSDTSLHRLQTAEFMNRWTYYAADFIFLTGSIDGSYNYLNSTDCNIHDSLSVGASAAADISLGQTIKIYPAVKLLYDNSQYIPVPKLGVTWNFASEFSLSANGYRIFAVPTFNELYWTESSYAKGNEDLDNEDGWGTDIIFAWKRTSGDEVSVTAFTAYYNNKIQWAADSSGVWSPQNVAKAAYFGGSLSAHTNEKRMLSVGATYNLTLTYLLTGGLTLADNKRIMYTPVHTGSAYVTFKYKKFDTTFSGVYTGLRYLSNLNISYLDPYFLLDISTDYQLTNVIKLYAAVKNILDTEYYETEDYPMPGRSLTVGVKAQW